MAWQLLTKGQLKTRMNTMKILTLLLVIGIAGSIFFFPMRIDVQRSCLMDSFINAHAPMESHAGHSHTGMEAMAQKYILPYGLLWWLSLAITYMSIRRMAKARRRRGKSELFSSAIMFSLWFSFLFPKHLGR